MMLTCCKNRVNCPAEWVSFSWLCLTIMGGTSLRNILEWDTFSFSIHSLRVKYPLVSNLLWYSSYSSGYTSRISFIWKLTVSQCAYSALFSAQGYYFSCSPFFSFQTPILCLLGLWPLFYLSPHDFYFFHFYAFRYFWLLIWSFISQTPLFITYWFALACE